MLSSNFCFSCFHLTDLFESAFGPYSIDNSRVCPGICVSTPAAIFCPRVINEIQCFTPNTKCCVRNGFPSFGPQFINYNQFSSDINKTGTNSNRNISNGQYDPTICRGYCILKSLKNTCEKPAKIIKNTSNCVEDTICCDTTQEQKPLKPKPPRPTRPMSSTSITTNAPPLSFAPTIDARKECPGICIGNLIRFTCYGKRKFVLSF